MNAQWKEFLSSQQARITEDGVVFSSLAEAGQSAICPITHLAVLTVSGKDAAKLLQGQITCNIQDITATRSSLGAICNPKGRVIAVFVMVQADERFLLVLPVAQLEAVKNQLSRYVLRADVSLVDSSENLCLLGRWQASEQAASALLATSRNGIISINFSGRDLLIAKPEQAMALWAELVGQAYQSKSPAHWQYADILAGIPWLCPASAEEYIPQMLNLDRLGAISFTKGCYTGQEIIARTHYLGKAKRAMFLGECVTAHCPDANTEILDANTDQAIGQVLATHNNQNICHLLMVLQESETGVYEPKLPDQAHITLLPLNYD
jgi:folate-binding protein YgfZ